MDTGSCAALVSKPEVEDIIRKLSAYGLAVCVPHMHRVGDREIVPLPGDTVAIEDALHVSFVSATVSTSQGAPVAWRWRNGRVEACGYCCIGPKN